MAFWAAQSCPLRPTQVSTCFRTYVHTAPWGIYHPGFAAALPSALKTLRSWEPNKARPSTLKEYHFVFVREKGLEVPAGILGGGWVWQSRTWGIHRELWHIVLVKDTHLGQGNGWREEHEGGASCRWHCYGKLVVVPMNGTRWCLFREYLPGCCICWVVDTFYVDLVVTPADLQKQSTRFLCRYVRSLCMSGRGVPWRTFIHASYGCMCISCAEPPFPPTQHPNPHQWKSLQLGKWPLRLQSQYLTVCIIILWHLLFVFRFNSAYLQPRQATKHATTPLKLRADTVFVEASAPAPSPAPETSQPPTVWMIHSESHPANTLSFSFIFSLSLKLGGFHHVNRQTWC